MIHVFNELNKQANLPFILNVNVSRTIQRFDMNAVAHADDETLMRSPYNFDSLDIGQTVIVPAWTPIQLCVRYACALFRFQSLEPIAQEISCTRGVEIFPLLVPMGSAWQAGKSQFLWILMHTLCAPSVARVNVYLNVSILEEFLIFRLVRRMFAALASQWRQRILRSVQQTRRVCA